MLYFFLTIVITTLIIIALIGSYDSYLNKERTSYEEWLKKPYIEREVFMHYDE